VEDVVLLCWLWSPILFDVLDFIALFSHMNKEREKKAPISSHAWIKKGKKVPIKLKGACGHLIPFQSNKKRITPQKIWMHLQDNSTEELDVLVSVKFGKAWNIARQREYHIWCCSLRGSLAQLPILDSQIELGEFYQTLFFRIIYY
jgi:hypothetical protein